MLLGNNLISMIYYDPQILGHVKLFPDRNILPYYRHIDFISVGCSKLGWLSLDT